MSKDSDPVVPEKLSVMWKNITQDRTSGHWRVPIQAGGDGHPPGNRVAVVSGVGPSGCYAPRDLAESFAVELVSAYNDRGEADRLHGKLSEAHDTIVHLTGERDQARRYVCTIDPGSGTTADIARSHGWGYLVEEPRDGDDQ